MEDIASGETNGLIVDRELNFADEADVHPVFLGRDSRFPVCPNGDDNFCKRCRIEDIWGELSELKIPELEDRCVTVSLEFHEGIVRPAPGTRVSVIPRRYVMGMETMTLEQKTETVDLTTLSDTNLESWFANAGLDVEAVSHCNSAGCEICFPTIQSVRAA